MMGEVGRILIVDDDRQVRFVLRAALLKLGPQCEVTSAADGQEALRMLQGDSYDLLISDVRLPGLNGLELTEAVRQLGLRVTVIWMTDYGSAHLQAAARRLGVFRCLEKPIEVPVIREATLAGLNRARLHAQPDLNRGRPG
jgi:CheY-like chemotaxis protein